jgi:hypothetical protein
MGNKNESEKINKNENEDCNKETFVTVKNVMRPSI